MPLLWRLAGALGGRRGYKHGAPNGAFAALPRYRLRALCVRPSRLCWKLGVGVEACSPVAGNMEDWGLGLDATSPPSGKRATVVMRE